MVKLRVIGEGKTSFGKYINAYNGCTHDCVYCYAKGMAHKNSSQWQQAVPKAAFIDNLKHDIDLLNQNQSEKQAIKDIWLSSFTDCYQPLEREYRMTRQTVELLKANDLPFTILTKSASVLDDLNLFKGYSKCRVGLTITSLDEEYRKKLEPHTSTTDEKIAALETLWNNGIKTYCSVEPITAHGASDPIAIVKRLADAVDLFEFGMIKDVAPLSYGDSYIYYDIQSMVSKIRDVIIYCKGNNIDCCTASHSKERLIRYQVPIIPTPTVIP